MRGMRKKAVKKKRGQSGNVMLITVIILLILLVIVGTVINVAGMQFDLAFLERNTSNTYYVAKSGIEKQVDTINKALDTQLSTIAQEVSTTYLPKLLPPSGDVDQLTVARGGAYYEDFGYDSGTNKIYIKSPGTTGLSTAMSSRIYDFIKTNFMFETDGTTPKMVMYTVQSDRVKDSYKTKVMIKTEPIYDTLTTPPTLIKTAFKLIATAQTVNGTNIYDTQMVEAVVDIEIPTDIDNAIYESYKWVAGTPELLDSALTCFGDVVITKGGKLNVASGSVRVKGSKKVSNYVKEASSNVVDVASSTITEADEMGGVIVSNGGSLQAVDVYCINNIAVTNGFTGNTGDYNHATEINVSGDAIAYTLCIVDDYYKNGDNQIPFTNKGENLNITIGKNVFADNDVMIDRWIKGDGVTPNISVQGTIFGLSDASETVKDNHGNILRLSDGTTEFKDPNSSSGIFSQGEDTIIEAGRVFVNGQPYISLDHSSIPMKLWESVGEPFDGVSLWGGYAVGKEEIGNKGYVVDSLYSDYIKKNKVRINSLLADNYAPAYISAVVKLVGGGMGSVSGEAQALISSNTEGFFYRGNYSLTTASGLSAFTNKDNNYTDKMYLLQQQQTSHPFYNGAGGTLADYKKPGMYGKDYAAPTSMTNYLGMRAYVTAMRSVFYGKFNGAVPKELTFDDVVDLSGLSSCNWSYANPIHILAGTSTIDLDDYKVTETTSGGILTGIYPTIIINPTNEILTLKQTGIDAFRGIIISKGDVVISGNVKVEGSLIIGGTNEGANPVDRKTRIRGECLGAYSPSLLIGSGATLEIAANPDLFLKVKITNKSLLRQVTDGLKLTQYGSYNDLKKIMGPTINTSEKTKYTIGRVFYSKDSFIEIETSNIYTKIAELRKIR